MTGVELFPKEFGFVVLDIVLYCFLNIWMQIQVRKARNKYKVFYPTLYATEADNKDAKLFNCVQRGHQNSLESMPIFFTLAILGGFRHPIIAGSFGLLYVVGRYFYFTGYASGNPDNRLSLGRYATLGLLGLLICTISFAVTPYRVNKKHQAVM